MPPRPRMFAWTVAAAAAILAASAGAATSVWTGALSADWFADGNWSPPGIPTTDSHVVVDDTAVTPLALTNETPLLASFVLSNATLTVSNWATRIRADRIVLEAGAVLTAAPRTPAVPTSAEAGAEAGSRSGRACPPRSASGCGRDSRPLPVWSPRRSRALSPPRTSRRAAAT